MVSKVFTALKVYQLLNIISYCDPGIQLRMTLDPHETETGKHYYYISHFIDEETKA